MDFKLLGYSWKLAEILKLRGRASGPDFWELVSPLHHCPIAWSISDRSVFACGVKVTKAVKSYEIESAVLAPRRISVMVAVQLGIVVINNHTFRA